MRFRIRFESGDIFRVSTDSTAVISCHDDGVSDTFGAWRNRILFVTDDQTVIIMMVGGTC